MSPVAREPWRSTRFGAKVCLAAVVCAGTFATCGFSSVRAGPPEGQPWVLVHRAISQDRASGQVWQLDYTLRNAGALPVPLGARDVSVQIESWVSNSTIAEHATPRRSTLSLAALQRNPAECVILAPPDETGRCLERGSLGAWPSRSGDSPPAPAQAIALRVVAPLNLTQLVVAPAESLHLRIRLEHVHFLYGPYEPLFGTRDVRLRLGSAAFLDHVKLEPCGRPASASVAWPPFEPPPDRRDCETYLSPPDSLRLTSQTPGLGYYRHVGPIRYDTRMRLGFWYLIAPGSQGRARLSITQRKQGPGLFETLPEGQHEVNLADVGSWTRVERVFRTEPEATTLTLEFCLIGEPIEVWIDDLELAALDSAPEGP
jgi:hypothetical protein